MKKFVLIAAMVLLGMATLAQASLIDRGNGLFYDTDYNITWYDNSHMMSWVDATNWAASINVGGVTGWKLPSASPRAGYAMDDISHLWLVETGHFDPYIPVPPFSTIRKGYSYWTSDLAGNGQWAWFISPGNGYGDMTGTAKAMGMTSWSNFVVLEHSGDVGAPVPIPAAVWLLGSGLLGLWGIKRKSIK